MTTARDWGLRVKAAAPQIAGADTNTKNQVLLRIADALLSSQADILAANAEDVAHGRASGLNEGLIDRLTLTEARLNAIAEGVRQVATLDDPVGGISQMIRRPNGLMIGRQRVPLGVVGLIYEARPNVTVDAAVLCLKAGNAVLLRGGKEAFHSNQKLTDVMRAALEASKLPADAVCLIDDTSRQSAVDMMALTGILDVLIPRGGAGLIRSVVENARVPVIETGVGNCHVYVDTDANLDMACEIVFNAKTSRPSVCNAAESLLVARPIAGTFLPKVFEKLKTKGVQLFGCPETRAVLGSEVQEATPEDYAAEYLDQKLSVRVVSGVEQALAHIAEYGTRHSEAIVTDNYGTAQTFLNRVDAAAVYVNASTRFTDGFEFGLGAEIGISTQKLHARGPMGLAELTTQKFIVYGQGQIR